LRLLDDFRMGGDVAPLTRMTATLKLRVSMLSQTTAAALRSRGLAAQAGGLGYIKSQPTADRKIQKETLTGLTGCEMRRDRLHPVHPVSPVNPVQSLRS
jgi:hypothetical protein